jgi:hypothetical protein
VLHLAQGSREVTQSSGNDAPSDIAVCIAKEGVKGDKKGRKHRPQGTMTTTNHGNDSDKEVGGTSVRCISTTVHNDKHQTRPPMNHFRRFLEEACPNHTYLVRHKLKDNGMMRSFMTLGPSPRVQSSMKT